MDDFYSISILGEAEDCGMELEKFNERTSSYCSFSNKNCCNNENLINIVSIVNQEKEISLSLKQTDFFTFFVISKYYLFKSNLNKFNPHKYYSHLNITKNLSVLYQAFII